MSSNMNAKGFLMGFIAGGTIGTVITLLTANKSGKELRSDIKQKSGEYYDEADKYYQGKKSKATEMITEGKNKYATIMNDIKSKPEEIIKDAESIYNAAKEKIRDILPSKKDKIENENLKYSFKSGTDENSDNKKS